MMRATAVAFVVAAALTSASPTTATATAFDDWLEAFRSEALGRGITATTFDRAFARVEPIARVIELDRRQPEFTQTFWTYLDKRVTPERIDRGRALLARHRALLERVQQSYGVQPRFVVALWGLESNYGDHTGTYPLVAALATLAHDARRSDFFRAQLFSTLELMQRGDIPFDAEGSWAGAMGQPQFMPTTYRDFAVDFDGDGRRDLWNSLPDIFASAANYLAAAGWQGDRTWGREVRLPAGFDYAFASLEVEKPLAEWQRLGVRRTDQGPLPAVAIEGSIVLPAGATDGPALLTYRNFRAVMAWNRSILYAIAVGHLSDRLADGAPFAAVRPVREVPLSVADVTEMQRRLGELGYDAGEADGVVGAKTRNAIRTFQQQVTVPADGHPTPDLLERLRRASGQ